MSCLVSIIVPVYNVINFFPGCINSILSQTYSDIELVVVDDGSTDGCSQLIDTYCDVDHRVKVIHKQNEGLNAARRDGFKLSCGEWVLFVDGDDTLEIDAVENLLNFSDATTDIVVGFAFDNTGNEKDVNIETWRRMLIKSDPVLCTAWAKLYRRTVMSESSFNLQFAPRTRGQDMPMNIKIAFATNKRVKISPFKVYNYLERRDSLSKTVKWSIGNIENLYLEVKHSIPKDMQSEYMYQLVENRVIAMRKMLLSTSLLTRTHYADSCMVQELRSDVLNCSKLNWLSSLMINYPDSVSVRLLVRLSLFSLVLRQSIVRRFGLILGK